MCAFCAPRVMPLVLVVCVYLGVKSAQVDTLALIVAGLCLLACQESKTRHRSGINPRREPRDLPFLAGTLHVSVSEKKRMWRRSYTHAYVQATEICTHAYSAVWYGICLYHGRGGEGSLGMNTTVSRAPAESRRYITRTYIVELPRCGRYARVSLSGSAKGNVSSFVG